MSGAAGRLIFDTPVEGDDHLMIIMTILDISSLKLILKIF